MAHLYYNCNKQTAEPTIHTHARKHLTSDAANVWITYASAAVALLALIVSSASFFVALASYKRQGADVVAYYYIQEPDSSAPTIRMKIANRGLATIPVLTIWVIVRHGLLTHDQQRVEPPYAEDWEGATLPPSTTREFHLDYTGGYISPPTPHLERRLRIRLVLGDGRHVRARRF
jgi:hypothetical protein